MLYYIYYQEGYGDHNSKSIWLMNVDFDEAIKLLTNDNCSYSTKIEYGIPSFITPIMITNDPRLSLVYRKAFDLNESKIYEEIGFTDIHHASQTGKSTNVDNWSAGCQVIADIKNWNEFIGLCQESVKIFGNSFTYTLINEKDLDDIKVVA